MSERILEVENLVIRFFTAEGEVHAVDGISFHLNEGETLAVVGESGSGKSVTALAVLRLLPTKSARVLAGSIRFRGEDVLGMSEKELRRIRGNRIAMIFQDPMTSLNPVFTVGEQIIESMLVHGVCSDRKEAARRAIELLEMVRVPMAANRMHAYPHQLSGGMRQRAMIAMALSCNPDVLIADEPTTALDVTVQAQIIELLEELRRELGMAIIIITHDLGVVAEMADRMVIVYAGRGVETGTAEDIFYRSRMPYTWGLMASIPRIDRTSDRLYQIRGFPPNPIDPPKGCRFGPRCEYAEEICFAKDPPMIEVGPGHAAACHFAGDPEFAERRAVIA